MKDSKNAIKVPHSTSFTTCESIRAIAPLATLLLLIGIGRMQKSIHLEAEATRKEFIKHKACAGSKNNESASFHWDECRKKMILGFRDLGMTERQTDVALGIVEQETYREIATRLQLEERTVRWHVSSIFQKLGCTKRADFMTCALKAMENLPD